MISPEKANTNLGTYRLGFVEAYLDQLDAVFRQHRTQNAVYFAAIAFFVVPRAGTVSTDSHIETVTVLLSAAPRGGWDLSGRCSIPIAWDGMVVSLKFPDGWTGKAYLRA
jgi:hypothetical protein